MEKNPEFELSGYLEDTSQEAIDDVADKIDPTNQEEMTRKTITGEQIDTGLMHIPFVKEPAGELNKFSRWEERPLQVRAEACAEHEGELCFGSPGAVVCTEMSCCSMSAAIHS